VKLIGAGLGRTGTASLKKALEILLDGPCYHMLEVMDRPQDVAVWRAALNGRQPDWSDFLKDYRASVDWPGTPFWQPLAQAFPEAPILLSTRENAQVWWQSASRTVFAAGHLPAAQGSARAERLAMLKEMWSLTLTPDWDQPQAAMQAYEAHNQSVRQLAPAHRLFEWQPGQGWEPLCRALGLPVPGQPFPHLNTTDDFRRMLGLEN